MTLTKIWKSSPYNEQKIWDTHHLLDWLVSAIEPTPRQWQNVALKCPEHMAVMARECFFDSNSNIIVLNTLAS